jgi:hypothetical protein
MDPQAIRKEASLGHTVFSPWPKKMLNEAADEIERLREALTEIERLYYTEAKDASWRAAHMRAIATSALTN